MRIGKKSFSIFVSDLVRRTSEFNKAPVTFSMIFTSVEQTKSISVEVSTVYG